MSKLPTISNRKTSTALKASNYNFITTNEPNKKLQKHKTKRCIELIDVFKRTKSLLNSKILQEDELDYDRYLKFYEEVKQNLDVDNYLSRTSNKMENTKLPLIKNVNPTKNRKQNINPVSVNPKSLKILLNKPVPLVNLKSKALLKQSATRDNYSSKINTLRMMESMTNMQQDNENDADNLHKRISNDKSIIFKQAKRNREKSLLDTRQSNQAFLKSLSNKKRNKSIQLNLKEKTMLSIIEFNKHLKTKKDNAITKFNVDYDCINNFNEFYSYLLKKETKQATGGSLENNIDLELLKGSEFEELTTKIQENIKLPKDLNTFEKNMANNFASSISNKKINSKLQNNIADQYLISSLYKKKQFRSNSTELKSLISAKTQNKVKRSKSSIFIPLNNCKEIHDNCNYITTCINKVENNNCLDSTQFDINHQASKKTLETLIKIQSSESDILDIKNENKNASIDDMPVELITIKQNSEDKENFIPQSKAQQKDNKNQAKNVFAKKNKKMDKEMSKKAPTVFTNNDNGDENHINDNNRIKQLVKLSMNMPRLSFNSLNINDKPKINLWMNIIKKLSKTENLDCNNIIGYYTTAKLVHKDFLDVILSYKERINFDHALEQNFSTGARCCNKNKIETLEAFVTKIKTDINIGSYVLAKAEREIMYEEENNA